MEVSSIVNTKNTCAIKKMCQFSELFDVNNKNSSSRLYTANDNQKETKSHLLVVNYF